MSTFPVGWAEKLQATRTWLSQVSQANDAENYSKLTGTLNFLFSDINPQVINAEMRKSSNASEYRPVEIRYIPHKGTNNLTTSAASANCTRVAQRRDKIQTLNTTLYVEDKFTIDEDYVRENAENGMNLQNRLNKEFRDAMRVGRESMDSQAFSKLAGAFGSNPAQEVGAGTYTDLPLIINSSGKIDDRNFDVIMNDLEDNYMSGPVSLLGLGNARRYMNRLAVGNANDAGIDYKLVSDEFGMVLWKDSYTTSVLGDANYVLAVYPGMTQFFQYSLYSGSDFMLNHGGLIKGTMPDPVLPITWDYILDYDKNCTTGNGHQGAWVGRVFTYFDLWIVNEDAFGDVYDELNDFNGIVGYNITES